MSKGTEPSAAVPAATIVRDVLTQLAREGARRMLAMALEDEVAAYVAAAIEDRDERGRRLVVRNGHAEEREIQTGVGPVAVRAPRVRDGRKDEAGEPVRFTSKILPPYLRKTRSVEELLPWPPGAVRPNPATHLPPFPSCEAAASHRRNAAPD